MKKVLFFGSDAVSHVTLKAMLAGKNSQIIKSNLQILCPPMPRNKKTPLGAFHSYIRDQDLPPLFTFKGK
jgi:hypothetical protein